MKKKFSDIIIILIFIVGLSLLLYPSVADYWNSIHQSKAIQTYCDTVAELDDDQYQKILDSAIAYNQKLISNFHAKELSEIETKQYNNELNFAGDGIMGYIEIPTINCTLPIYHGTNEAVLQIAIGHCEWSSLPVGGENTHCVLSGHRGLPSAKLFSDLDVLVEGDIFIIRVLNEVYTYEVDQILIVEPHEVNSLHIEEGEDYVTLVTCTPYGVNTHRLLVRGHRIANIEESGNIHIVSDATQIEPLLIAPIFASPILIILLIVLMRPKNNKRKEGNRDESN